MTAVTVEAPVEAKVIRPVASTTISAFVYDPGITVVFSREIVPTVVIGPPVKPVPVEMKVTPPPPPPLMGIQTRLPFPSVAKT